MVEPKLDNMPKLRLILRGIQVQQAKKGKQPQQRLPITPFLLRRLKTAWITQNSKATPRDQRMLWAAATTTFFTFCRSGEITVPSADRFDPGAHLSFHDVQCDNPHNPSIISLHIKQSKTDQTRKGVKVYMGKTNDDLCPVSALLLYLELRGPHAGPLFQWSDGLPLSRPRFVKEVKVALARSGVLAANYSGHSFRSGAATTAAAAGLEDSVIQTLGR